MTETTQQGFYEAVDIVDVTKFSRVQRIWRTIMRQWPRANEDRSIIIVELHKNRSKRTTLLTNISDRFRPSIVGACDQILLISVPKDPFEIEIKEESYHLEDNVAISVRYKVDCQIQDALQLWKTSKALDAVLQTVTDSESKGANKTTDKSANKAANEAMCKLLEARVTRYTRKFFQNTTSTSLLNTATDLVQSLQQSATRTTARQRLEDELEREAKRIQIDGLQLLLVDAKIDWTKFQGTGAENQPELQKGEHPLKKVYDYAHRQRINFLLDNDTTFAPYNLRHIIMVLDPNLLENFYVSQTWEEAMKDVHKALKTKKEAVEQAKEEELKSLKELIQAAHDVRMREEEMRRLQALFVDKLIEHRTSRQGVKSASHQAFLQEVLGPVPANPKRLTVKPAYDQPTDEIL